MSNLINKYDCLIATRNSIIVDNQHYIKAIIVKNFKNVFRNQREELESIGIECLIKALFTYDDTKGLSFKSYLYSKIPYLIIDGLRKENPSLRYKRDLERQKRNLLEEIGDINNATFEQCKKLKFLERKLNEYETTNLDTPIGTQESNENKLTISDIIPDKHNDYNLLEDKQVVREALKYLYGYKLYAIKLRYNFYDVHSLKNKFLKDYFFHLRSGLKKLRLIIKTQELKVAPKEQEIIKKDLKLYFSTINSKYTNLLLKHFGFIDGKCYTRSELSMIYKLPIETVDQFIYKHLSKFDSYPFIKLYSMSLDVEKKAKTSKILLHANNFKSFLSDEELDFFTHRFDFKKNVIRNLRDLAQFYHTTEEKLILLERNFIDKLKFFEPKLYKRILQMHKDSIKSGHLKKHILKNTLFMLSDLQFNIVSLHKGIFLKRQLYKNVILKRLNIDSDTYDREFNNAMSIIRKHIPLNLRSKFLHDSYKKAYDKRFKKMFKLKFIDLLSPQEIAKKLNISLNKYLSLEQDILKKGKIWSTRLRSEGEKRLLNIYMKSFLNKRELTYKEKLEHSLFMLKCPSISKLPLITILYSFGLFDTKIKSTLDIARLFHSNISKIAAYRQEGVKIFSNYLNIPYLGKLCYAKQLPNLNKQLSPEIMKDIERIIYKKVEKFKPLDKEIFYRNYGLKSHKKETYEEIGINLNLSRDFIDKSLIKTAKKVKSLFPTNLFLHYIICKNKENEQNFANKTQILKEIRRYKHLFNSNAQKAINIIFGLANNNLQINCEIQKINMPEGTFYKHQRDILPIYELLLGIKFNPNDTLK